MSPPLENEPPNPLLAPLEPPELPEFPPNDVTWLWKLPIEFPLGAWNDPPVETDWKLLLPPDDDPPPDEPPPDEEPLPKFCDANSFPALMSDFPTCEFPADDPWLNEDDEAPPEEAPKLCAKLAGEL